MSAFLDALSTDISDSFFNNSEFGELHQVNSKPDVACIFDTTDEPFESGFKRYEGYAKKKATLYIRESDLPSEVMIRKLISIDKSEYRIIGSSSNAGMAELSLEAVK